MCAEEKPLTREHWDARGAGLQHTCKPCARQRTKQWQTANRDRVRAYTRAKSGELATYIAEQKSAPCLDCGVRYPPHVMDFDHLRDKEMQISSMANSRASMARIVAEISKCEVVCANCHRERTHQRREDRLA